MTFKGVWQAAALGLAMMVAAPVSASEWDQKTIFTFSGPVELPGRTLPAGTYTFKLADVSDRHIVQIFNKDESQIIATMFTFPARRSEPSDDPIVMFAERTENMPPAVQYWYYPGRTSGHEFVYPRQQAIRIARAANKPVLATTSASQESSAMQDAKITTVTPQGQESEYRQRGDFDTEPASASTNMQTGQSAQDTGSRRSEPASTVAQELPRTASAEPMLLLLAFSSFLGLSTMGFGRRS